MLLRSAQLPTAVKIDIEHGADEIATVAEGYRLLDVGKELELVLDDISARTASRR